MLIFLLSAVCVLAREWVDSSMELTETHRAKPNINNWRFLEWNDKKKKRKNMKNWIPNSEWVTRQIPTANTSTLYKYQNITSHLHCSSFSSFSSFWIHTWSSSRRSSRWNIGIIFDFIHIQTTAAAVKSRQHITFGWLIFKKRSLSGFILNE